MKNVVNIFLIGIYILITVFLSANNSRAQSPSPTSAPKPSETATETIDKLKQIKELKEKIATKVAELREKEKAGLFGSVGKIDKTTITLSTAKGDRNVTFSEDTFFYQISGNNKKEISIKNIDVDDTISVFGYTNDDKSLTSAKYIYLHSPLIYISGKISAIDKENFTITVIEKEKEILVDIEKYTTNYVFDKNKNSLVKIGFSKLTSDSIAHIIGTANANEKNRISANRIYVFSLTDATVASPTAQKPTAAITKTNATTTKASSPTAIPTQ